MIYNPDGVRIVIGEAEIDGDEIRGEITNSGVAEALFGPMDMSHFSIGEDPVRHNVFDPEKKD